MYKKDKFTTGHADGGKNYTRTHIEQATTQDPQIKKVGSQRATPMDKWSYFITGHAYG